MMLGSEVQQRVLCVGLRGAGPPCFTARLRSTRQAALLHCCTAAGNACCAQAARADAKLQTPQAIAGPSNQAFLCKSLEHSIPYRHADRRCSTIQSGAQPCSHSRRRAVLSPYDSLHVAGRHAQVARVVVRERWHVEEVRCPGVLRAHRPVLQEGGQEGAPGGVDGVVAGPAWRAGAEGWGQMCSEGVSCCWILRRPVMHGSRQTRCHYACRQGST
jgi:hypothetical protein